MQIVSQPDSETDVEATTMTQRARQQIWIGLTLVILISGCAGNKKPERQILSPDEEATLLEAIAPIQEQVDQQQTQEAEAALKQLKLDYPGIAQYDLKSFTKAELSLSRQKRARAAKHYKKIIQNYPDSVLYDPSMERVFDIGRYYLEGPVVFRLLCMKIKGYDRGVKLLELVSDELGIDDPNGMGLKAMRMSAHSLQERHHYEDAFLKWLEISTVWESETAGQEALLHMAQCQYASYQNEPPHRRPLFDSNRLEESRTYYQRYISLYPEDADEKGIPDIIAELEEQLALKQLTIARFYQRTGESSAAHLYFKRVVNDWPKTEAAQAARKQLDQITDSDSTKG